MALTDREPDPDHVDPTEPIEVRLLRLAWAAVLVIGILAALAAPVVAVAGGGSPWPTLLAVVASLVVARVIYRVALRSALARDDEDGQRAAREAGPSLAQQVMDVLHAEGPTFPARFVAATSRPLDDVERALKALSRHGGVELRPDGRWALGPKAPKR